MPASPSASSTIAQRQRWMAALARAGQGRLEAALSSVSPTPIWRRLRAPEVGLTMIRARIGGGGGPFNLGEATLTRAAVGFEDGRIGFAWVLGRAPRAAELAAVFDGLLQDDDRRDGLMDGLIAPIEAEIAERRGRRAGAVAASRVDFMTMVRGE